MLSSVAIDACHHFELCRNSTFACNSAGRSNPELVDVPAYQGPVAAPPPDYDYEDTVTIRYNVTAVDGLFTQNSNAIRMTVRYLDPGDYASLTVKLIEKNLTTSKRTTRLSFASNQYPSSTAIRCNTHPMAIKLILTSARTFITSKQR